MLLPIWKRSSCRPLAWANRMRSLIMCWHVSRLVIATWRHRLAQLLRCMPGLWLFLPLWLLALPLTGLLAYGFFHELGESLLVGDGLVRQLRPLVMLSLCNFFLVFSFMILSLVIMLSP